MGMEEGEKGGAEVERHFGGFRGGIEGLVEDFQGSWVMMSHVDLTKLCTSCKEKENGWMSLSQAPLD